MSNLCGTPSYADNVETEHIIDYDSVGTFQWTSTFTGTAEIYLCGGGGGGGYGYYANGDCYAYGGYGGSSCHHGESMEVVKDTEYTVVVGDGGTGGIYFSTSAEAGETSSFGGVIFAIGGGDGEDHSGCYKDRGDSGTFTGSVGVLPRWSVGVDDQLLRAEVYNGGYYTPTNSSKLTFHDFGQGGSAGTGSGGKGQSGSVTIMKVI